MLPKVATQLLHHTTRAVAAVQGSGHAFRNVLQSSSSGTTTTASWSGVGASGSSWGSAGTGAGGAKYQSSSKFYHGYQVGFRHQLLYLILNARFAPQGAGRTLTQAGQASAVDSGLSQTDDTEDPFIRPRPINTPARRLTGVRRPRSHSLVLGSQGQVDDTETSNRSGVLEVVRIHARASHAFAPHNSAADEVVTDATLDSRPKLSRRASTSSVTSPLPLDDVPPSFHPQSATALPLDPPTIQSTGSPIEDQIAQLHANLTQYSSEKDDSVCTYVNQLLGNHQFPLDASVYEAAIEAVVSTHRSRADFTLLIQLFDQMIRRNLSPSPRAYQTLILAHLQHDYEASVRAGHHQRRFAADKAKRLLKDIDREVWVSKRSRSRNFRNAIRIFQSANKAHVGISLEVYANLLHACVRHLNEYAALRVFAHLEKEHGSRIPARTYCDMMHLYTTTDNLAAAEETFAGFKKAAQLGNVSYDPIPVPDVPYLSHVSPWDLMIDIYFSTGRQTEALEILETMLDPSYPSTLRPSLSTFRTIIFGFCRDEDIETALKWFKRLLQETTIAEDASSPLSAPPRPDVKLWKIVIGALAKGNMIDEINSLHSEWLSTNARDSPLVVAAARELITQANIVHLESLQWNQSMTSGELQKKVDHVVDKIVGDPRDLILASGQTASHMMHGIIKLYGRDGRFDEAAKFLQTYVAAHQSVVGAELTRDKSRLLFALSGRVSDATEWILRRQVLPPLAVAKIFVSTTNSLGKVLSTEAAEAYLSIYEASKKSGKIGSFAVSDAEALIAAGVRIIYTNTEPIDGQPESHPLVRFETLLTDIAGHLQDLSTLSPTAIDGVLRGLHAWYPLGSLRAVLEKLGEPWSALWNQPFVQEQVSLIAPAPAPEAASDAPVDGISEPSTPSSGTAVAAYRTSSSLSQEIDGHLNQYGTPSPTKAYETFLSGCSDGFYPTTSTFGRLISALGRAREVEKVNFVYEAAQHAIATSKAARSGKTNGPWYQIEDHMIVALAHAGNVEGAHEHRLRILECGGTPSADAYGALISCVKDTTDDSANAYSLYRESQIRGVVPNVYLYNTMISKLSKARKADLAMELFSKMKENGFWPSSVSYGAVIGACSRVGDVESAEALFEEMSSQPNFKPRVPPFNTMMQLYTHTKRNRDKVLHYYDSMISAGVRPTAHTYKVCPPPSYVILDTLTLAYSSLWMHIAPSNL